MSERSAIGRGTKKTDAEEGNLCFSAKTAVDHKHLYKVNNLQMKKKNQHLCFSFHATSITDAEPKVTLQARLTARLEM